jgi:hypothetical protein
MADERSIETSLATALSAALATAGYTVLCRKWADVSTDASTPCLVVSVPPGEPVADGASNKISSAQVAVITDVYDDASGAASAAIINVAQSTLRALTPGGVSSSSGMGIDGFVWGAVGRDMDDSRRITTFDFRVFYY